MKKLFITILLILTMVVNPTSIKAASASITVSNSKTLLIVGNTLTTTVTVSSATNLGAWSFDLKYDSSKLRLTSSSFGGGTYIADVVTSPTQKTARYTFTFTALRSGTTSVYVANSDVIAYDESPMSVTNGSRSVSIMTQAELEATYSKNNYLKTLTVEDYSITPTFDSTKSDYTVVLPAETKTAKILATLDDTKSSLTGTGLVNLVDGDNKFAILVTAQNGSQRTYNLTINVAELDPITVNLNNVDYTIVRKAGSITCPTLFTANKIVYNAVEVPSCYNETSKYALISLKDAAGTTNFYVYANDKFTLYKEVVINSLIFYPMAFPKDYKTTSNFTKATITIGNSDISVYQNKLDREFSLIYGQNMDTAEVGIYQYDAKEQTIQRYFDKELLDKTKTINKYLIIIIVLSALALSILGAAIALVILKLPKKHKIIKVIEPIKKES